MKIIEIKNTEKILKPLNFEEDKYHVYFELPDYNVEIVVDPEGKDYRNTDSFYIDFIACWGSMDREHIDSKEYDAIFSESLNRVNVDDDEPVESTVEEEPETQPEPETKPESETQPEEESIKPEEEPEKSVIQIMLANGDVYSMDADNVDWDKNSENIEQIEQFLVDFQVAIIKMMADQMSVEEVEETADAVLKGMNLPSYYIFPRTSVKPTKRETVILKMFDAYAAYAKIFAYTASYRTRKMVQNELAEEFMKIINLNDGSEPSDDISDVFDAAESIDDSQVETLTSED